MNRTGERKPETKVVTIRLTNDEVRLLSRMAKAFKGNKSEALRHCIYRAMGQRGD